MNDLINREDALMCLTGEYLEGKEYKLDEEIYKFVKRIQNIPAVPAISIPEGATNGDAIKVLLPHMKVEYYATFVRLSDGEHYIPFGKGWWNAPYKGGKNDRT